MSLGVFRDIYVVITAEGKVALASCYTYSGTSVTGIIVGTDGKILLTLIQQFTSPTRGQSTELQIQSPLYTLHILGLKNFRTY